MNERTLRLGNVAAGAVVIGGVLVVAMPREAVSILQLVIATVAVAGGLYALALHVPPSGWMSPFKWMSPFNQKVRRETGHHRLHETDSIRSKLSNRRQPVADGPPMPPEILLLLKPLIRTALNLDPDERSDPAAARKRLSPLTWAVLTSAPLREPHWYQTLRPDEREVTDVVHHVLDDIDHLAEGTVAPRQSLDINHRRTT
jgi:hypothetical protein